jgi:hypothetical protein
VGREIRRVPKDWKHPRDERKDRFIPMFDYDFDSRMEEWYQEWQLWKQGKHDDQRDYPFWEYEYPPDPDTCRPTFDSEPTHYQIYETVSEGTPKSPVFESLDDMVDWLIQEGHSEKAARNFAQDGYVPSMVMNITPGKEPKFWMGIHAAGKDY